MTRATEQAPAPVGAPTSSGGLTADQVARRVAAGQANRTTVRTSRSAGEIVRANVLTPFNAILGVLLVLVLLTGRWQNALFGGVVVLNAAFGVVQELRAKRTLDRLAVLTAPRARAVRDGRERDVDLAGVVLDDLLVLRTGDQVPVDGVVRSSTGLSVDEALLTGESEPVARSAGDGVLSGSIVVSGSGRVQATGVGDQAYAARLAHDARRFTTAHSEFVAGTNRILRWIAVGLVVVGPMVLWSQFRTEDNATWQAALTGTVAALVGMVPEGLVLLTTLAFLVATASLARRSVLVQELPAVEGLARVDVVCLDKTGTLTSGDVRFDRLTPVPGCPPPDAAGAAALGALARADAANATAAALAVAFPDPGTLPLAVVPFSSARKWSAERLPDGCTWVLGAPELVLPGPTDTDAAAARAEADRLASDGSRVLLLAASPHPWDGDGDEVRLPAELEPRALVLLAERIREDAPEVLRWFAEQGVAVKVLSGDNPRTVGAVAAAAGVPGCRGAGDALDARTLPEDPAALADVLEEHPVLGRVTPQQKRAVVAALQARGHVVAMTGDGVNDALALKDADVGVAMGNGAPATRAVAQLVLLDGRFAHLPEAVAAGRRVLADIERAANLFLVKNVYSLVLALLTVVTVVAYPLTPVQLTLVSGVTIGVPGFLLALGRDGRRYRPGFVHRVLRFSLPVGLATGGGAYAGYATARWLDPGAGLAGARTTATLVVLLTAWWTLAVLARPLRAWKAAMLATMALAVALAFAVPALREGLFQFDLTRTGLLVALAGGAAGAVLVELTARALAPAGSPAGRS